ncbi:hypothetical protein [Nocardioides stalactiti]|uniref:hypothetical protein n=1 Tax=Nocardioides stalactiti TaxID=2755356 RepID=UPI0015FED832|nr:hypothetical protein [Nocardioides stalactiti]
MTDSTPDPHVLEPGHAPTPFTGAQIRDATVAGKTLWRRVDEEGAAPYVRVSRFLDCDRDGALFERSMLTLDGQPLGEPQVGRVEWVDLQRHASFPAADTTIEDEVISTALGDLDCWRYSVGRGAEVHLFWFAKSLPGMPVQQEVRDDGRVTATVTALAGPPG